MTFNSGAALCALAAAWLVAQSPTAVAQTPPDGLKNPMVVLDYAAPKTAAFAPIRERLRQRHVLEKLQVFLAPLNLTEKLTVRTAECGALFLPYKKGQAVTLCYEYVAKIERDAPPTIAQIGQVWLTRDDALVGPVTQVILHDVALALFDMYKIPVWGNAEFAADHVAAYAMVHFGKQVAWKTVLGTAWFLWDEWDKPVDISDIRPHLAQRYFNLLCVAYAADNVTFGVFVPTKRQPTNIDLPIRRANRCARDYVKLDLAFKTTIYDPHVDKAKYQQLRTLEWLRDF